MKEKIRWLRFFRTFFVFHYKCLCENYFQFRCSVCRLLPSEIHLWWFVISEVMYAVRVSSGLPSASHTLSEEAWKIFGSVFFVARYRQVTMTQDNRRPLAAIREFGVVLSAVSAPRQISHNWIISIIFLRLLYIMPKAYEIPCEPNVRIDLQNSQKMAIIWLWKMIEFDYKEESDRPLSTLQ